MPSPKHILRADDDDHYAFILQLTLKKAGIESPVHHVASREEMIGYMAGEGRYANRDSYPLPALIILAFRLPLQNGFKALRWVRQRPMYNDIQVIVLSGIEYDDERGIATELGADCYAVKPQDFTDLVRIAERLRERWIEPDDSRAAP